VDIRTARWWVVWWSALALAASVMIAPGVRAQPSEIVVVTSFPPSFFEPFKTAFEAQLPASTVSFVQRNTNSAVRFILERPDVTADVFWASAVDAFEVLRSDGQLRAGTPVAADAPAMVSGFPVNDPGGHYSGFALSGYGFVYNSEYLVAHGLPVPVNWSDLTLPVYSGHIGITSPSRSGTTHLVVEAILQKYGWNEGWALLSRLGGNLSTITARSFGVASGVAQGRFGVGITVDFLATAPEYLPGTTVFAMPPETLFVPASIAVLTRSENPDLAEQFVAFVLSETGQALLLDPAINRIPVSSRHAEATLARYPGLLDQPGLLGTSPFDAGLSARRYELVNILFDEFIVRNRATLARLWRQANAQQARGSAADAGPLAQAVALLTTPPMAVEEADDDELMRGLRDIPTALPTSMDQAALVNRVQFEIAANLQAAEAILIEIEVGQRVQRLNYVPR
jgi:phosphoglycerate transport regulatory protein PgtC